MNGDRAVSADLTDASGERPTAVSIAFRDVFVCGGAIQTPAILQRAGFRHRVGRTLAVHPTVKLAARFATEMNVPDDVPVHQVKEFSPDISFGGSASHPGLIALALSDNWRAFGAAITAWPQIAVYYAAITSQGRGWVQAVPGLRDPIVTYRLTKRDRHLLGQGLARLALLMLEADALEVYPSFRDAPSVRTRADLATMTAAFAASSASVMTVHLCSTVPMGERTERVRRRQLRNGARCTQRPCQRRLAAARRAGCEPAGFGDGGRHPQCPPLRRSTVGMSPAAMIESPA